MSSSNNDLVTPVKRRNVSPPDAPLKKRVKKTGEEPAENALLLVSTNEDNGDIVTRCSNHPVLSGIDGHFGSIELFMSDERFSDVLGVVGGGGDWSVDRHQYDPEEIAELKKMALLELFSLGVHGGREAETGEVFRGTIVIV